ncbi:class I SAM-dependent methyltransferase [Kitasatospora sp. McL0602]|uniref:class I SAM-dependent methyltransferase n=1 Tax=Kitasatospora sp. McL0602 TaxID=3439530 RepID=UPI003F892BC7
MTQAKVVQDSIGWDVESWARCLPFWEQHSSLGPGARSALEVGVSGQHGNLSLWLAANGFRVVCSGVERPSADVRSVHARYGVADAITYEQVDVLDIPYTGAFDVVVFKSLLGALGMAGPGAVERQRRAVLNMYGALKPGGELWFAENACGSRVHEFLHNRFGWGRMGWRYLSLSEADTLLSGFETLDRTTLGLLGVFGRSERQRRVLGTADRVLLDRLVPEGWRYVIVGVARKSAGA